MIKSILQNIGVVQMYNTELLMYLKSTQKLLQIIIIF